MREETGILVYIADWHKLIEMETEDGSAYVTFFYAYYRGTTEELVSFVDSHQMTDEQIIALPLHDIGKVPCIPNLRWLIPMCFDEQHATGKVMTKASMK